MLITRYTEDAIGTQVCVTRSTPQCCKHTTCTVAIQCYYNVKNTSSIYSSNVMSRYITCCKQVVEMHDINKVATAK